MKRLLLALTVSTILGGGCAADNDSFWGIWNIGERSDARYKAEMSLGYFLRAGNFLVVEPNRKGRPEIQFEGGFYAIKSIEGKDDTYYFTLRYGTSIKSKSGKWEDVDISGVVAMHFKSKDEAWFEVLYDDKNTDPRFPKRDFPGKNVVYWRAQKVDLPVRN